MKKFYVSLVLLLFTSLYSFAQEEGRIFQLQTKLESLVVDIPGLNRPTDINVVNASLPNLLQSLAIANKVNLNIAPDLQERSISTNFSGALFKDILIQVCKDYNLTIDFTGTILTVRSFEAPYISKPHREIPMSYVNDKLTVELNKDTLYVAFKQLMQRTGTNIVFKNELSRMLLSGYYQQQPIDVVLDKIAFSNGLSVRKNRDGTYEFDRIEPLSENAGRMDATGQVALNNQNQVQRPRQTRRGSFYFQINENTPETLNVDFQNTAIATIINDIGLELNKNIFTTAPLEDAGVATAKADSISFDHLLEKILENTSYRFKKTEGIYYIGKSDQVSIRDASVIPLKHRSIEIMQGSNSGLSRRAGRTFNDGFDNDAFNSFNNLGNRNFDLNQTSRSRANQQRPGTNGTDSSRLNSEGILGLIPNEFKDSLKISVDAELNSFIVAGAAQDINRFRQFISSIDKPVPVILIEVMLLEVNRTALVETGIEWGLGEEPVQDQGNLFPTTDVTLGSNTINRIIGGDTFGSWNLGQVVPNFFARIKAMEANGDIKVRSAPRLSALNGHRANLSIGQTTYYAITQNNIIGSQNPQTTTITNYVPIDAEFAINIKPIVSGDGQITLDINVIQSTFTDTRIADDAPPGINSREFNSIIRVRNQDLVILGGLEEKIKDDSGTGVPFLARVPIIKWFFSKKRREDTRKKLTVLIKPTVIN